jgi:hypothetical protein
MSMTPTLPREVVLHDADPGAFAFYSWQNVAIACWTKQGTGDSLQRLMRVRETLHHKHPEGVSVIWLIADRAGLPTAEARANAKELMERYRERRAALACVLFGEGFWVSAMRAAITGVQALVPGKVPLKIFSTVEDVARWLPPEHEHHTAVRLDQATLLDVLRTLAARL